MKNNKYILFNSIFILLLSMLFCCLLLGFGSPFPAFAHPFAGGDGTTESPYEISTPEQLNSVRESVYLDKHFKLVSNIDMSRSYDFWEPIGDAQTPFSGTFDGNFHCIGLPEINLPNTNNIGLFGVSTGELINCEVLDLNGITGGENVGILVGYNSGGVITNCCTAVCYSVQGNNNVGGLAGSNDGTITKSYSLVDEALSGGENVGGLVGIVGGNGSISNGFSVIDWGSVGDSEANNAGGLAGSIESGGTVRYTYAAGSVTGNSGVGGLIGVNNGTVSDSYYDSDTTGQDDDTGKGIPKTTAEMQSQGTFENWDFSNVWRFPLDRSWMSPYPTLQINLPPSSVRLLTPADDVTGIATDTEVSIKFDRDILINDTSGIKIEYEDGNGQMQQVGGITTDLLGEGDSMDTITIGHDDFLFGTTYHVTFPENSIISYANYLENTGNSVVTWNITTLTAGFLSFGFPEETGAAVIDSSAGTIDIEVEYGTDVSNMEANFTTSSRATSVQVNGLEQVSGTTPNDFSNPVIYTVTADDGTTKDYTVNVTAASDQSNFITGLPEPGDKLHGKNFDLGIISAVDVYGQPLNGDYNVTVSSDQADGEVFSGSLPFTDGVTLLNINLNTVANHNLTINVEGVSTNQIIPVNVILEPAPEAEILTPADGEVLADTGAAVSIQFDRDITENDLSGIKIEYDDNGTLTEMSGVSAALSGRTITINHDDIADNTNYTVTIPENTVINSDNIGNGAITWSFKIVSFAGGDGTKDNPFRIATTEQLNYVRYYLDKYFELTADIDLSAYNQGSGWQPIGDGTTPFTGHFEGNDHTIGNLYINNSGTDNVGLFGKTATGAEITNIKLTAVNVNGNKNVASLVGWNDGGSITECSATGNVTSSDNNTGGLVGQNSSDGLITFSYAAVDVVGQGSGGYGGLVGWNNNKGHIDYCYATGSVTGGADAKNIGGLVGDNRGNSTISHSYATGAVSGSSGLGGLVGYDYLGLVSYSYYDRETTGQNDDSYKGTPKTTAEMQSQAIYEGWDFVKVWYIEDGQYPILRTLSSFPSPAAVKPANDDVTMKLSTTVSIQFDRDVTANDLSGIKIEYDDNGTLAEISGVSAALSNRTITITHDDFAYDTTYTVTIPENAVNSTGNEGNKAITWSFTILPEHFFVNGEGTEENPFQIATADQLNNVRHYPDKHYELISDIDLSGYDNWVPIKDPSFKGAFDGNFHTVSNLNINRPEEDNVGLFGYNSGGEIKNCYVSGNVAGGEYTGILVGCNSTSYYWGYLGEVIPGKITNCGVFGTVRGDQFVGGLTGRSSGNITESFSTASVTGIKDVGGLVGNLSDNTVKNSYATGSVAGTGTSYRIGGLVGSLQYPGVIENSYAVGNVSGDNYVGGLIGYKYAGDINNSYYDRETTGQNDMGKGTPKTTAEMQTQAIFGNWDFTNIWDFQEGNYPFLQALASSPAAEILIPANGAAEVLRDAAVSIRFDRDITANDLSVIKILYDNNGTQAQLSGVSAALTDRTITITHDPFEYGREYTVIIPGGTVKDPVKNIGNLDIFWSFTTDTVEMRSFGFDEQTGAAVIDSGAGTVSVQVAHGTDLTDLVASFTTSPCVQSVKVGDVEQTSGVTTNDFTAPVTYTLTADDGTTTKDYIVTATEAQDQSDFGVSPAASGDKITGTAFDLNISGARDVHGGALNGDLNVTVNSDQDGEVFNGFVNFSSGAAAVNITLDTIAVHNLTVSVEGVTGTKGLQINVVPPPSSDKDITAFSFAAADNGALDEDVTATINGTDITATVPHGTDVTSLVATFTATGESVEVAGNEQISGSTTQNFTNSVTYTVTAEDGSTKDYTVTVNIDTDASGFDLALAEAGDKMTGIPFDMAISNARNMDGELLNGDIIVTVISEEKYGANPETEEIFNGPLTFTNGDAAVSVTIIMDLLTSTQTYEFTVDVEGITDNQKLDVIIQQQPAPAVKTLTPADGATGVVPDAQVSVDFDRDIFAGDYFNDIYIHKGEDRLDRVSGVSGTINADKRTLTIAHDDFEYSTQYTVILPQDTVRNNVGIHDFDYYSWSFTTRAAPEAGIVTMMPANSTAEVVLDAAVSIQFDHDITANDLSRIRIEYDDGGIIKELTGVSGTIEGDNRTLTIAHDIFSYNDTFTVIIPESTLKDANDLGNPSIIWNFTTVKEPVVPVITYTPDSLTNTDVRAELTFVNRNTGQSPEENPYSVTEAVYTFIDNGEYTFTYTDSENNSYTIDAVVDWIDKTPPEGEISYVPETNTTGSVTISCNATDDRGGPITFIQPQGSNQYTVSQNGDYIFTFEDETENRTNIWAHVDWIQDSMLPEITYSTQSPTNEDVVATISFPGWTGVEITNNGGSNTYTFNDNGEFTFEYEDSDGNQGTAVAKVNWIDKESPSATLYYTPNSKTNGNVTVTFSIQDNISNPYNGEIKVFDSNGNLISGGYTFTDNGTYDFIIEDEAGNQTTVTATVDWIDRELNSDTHIVYSTTEPTNSNVRASVVFDNLTENVNFYQNEVYFADGNYFYTFTENEQFTFIYSDDAGNSDSVTASVDWIDKKAPTMEVAYSEESLTNQDVVVTFTGSDPDDGIWAVSGVDNLTWSRVSIAEENVTFEDKGDGVYTLTFSDNGTVDVVLTDKAGNETEQEININWIDKDAPIADVEYSTQGSTSGNVDVTISVRDLHAATISNVDQLPEYIQEDASNNYEYSKFPEYKYTFTQNGSYTFEVCDEAGNITTVPVVVTNIDRELPEVELYYSTEESTPYYVTAYLRTKESVKINGINEDSRWIIDKDGNYLYSQLEHTFIQNGEYVFEFTDSVGNRGAATAKVDWIENRPPEVSVRYSTQYFTNDEVEARLVLENDYNKGFKITNNDGSDTYTFTENGSFTFQYENDYGAKGEIMAEVDLIDRTPPVMDSIEYRPGGSTPKPYRHGTTIRILGHDDNSGMDSVADRWHWITENGDYVFEIEDRAGNKIEVPVEIDWIDKIPPEVTYSGNLDTMTNDDVIITLSSNEKVVIYNAYMPYDRSFHLEVESPDTLLKERTAILKKNGIYRFTFLDEAWNESGVIEVEVTNIDRVAPALTVSGEADMVIESKDEDKIMEFLKEGMSAVDDREGDITDNIQYEEVSTELRDNGDLVKVYECSVEDRAGNKSQTLTREVVISESYLPTVYIDGEVAGERITRTVGEGETHCIVPIAFTGFTGEYTVKMVSGEKPPAHFKSYFSSDIIYNSRFSSGRMKPLVLGPGVYTVYGYDMEMGYISIVIEINGGV